MQLQATPAAVGVLHGDCSCKPGLTRVWSNERRWSQRSPGGLRHPQPSASPQRHQLWMNCDTHNHPQAHNIAANTIPAGAYNTARHGGIVLGHPQANHPQFTASRRYYSDRSMIPMKRHGTVLVATREITSASQPSASRHSYCTAIPAGAYNTARHGAGRNSRVAVDGQQLQTLPEIALQNPARPPLRTHTAPPSRRWTGPSGLQVSRLQLQQGSQ